MSNSPDRSESLPAAREQSLHRLVRFVGLSQGVQPLLTFGVSVLIARALGPEGRGAYGLVVTTVSVLPLVVGFGLVHSIRYWAARGRVDRGSLVRTTTLLGAGLGALSGGIVAASWLAGTPSWLVPEGLGAAGAVAFAAVLFAAVLRGFWTNFLAGLERYGYGTWGANAAMAAQVAVLFVLWRLDRVSLDAVIVALAVQFAAAALLFPALAGSEIRAALRAPALPRSEVREMFRYGGWQYLSSLLMQTNMRINVFLLVALGGLHETGLYTAVLGPANFLQLVASPFNLVLTARTARRQDDPAFPARVAGALRLVTVLMLAIAVGAAAVAPVLLPWVFGEEFADAVLPFWLLLPGAIANSIVLAIAQYLQGAKRPDLNTRVSAVGAVLTVVLNALFIPFFGASGAALAYTLSFVAAGAFAVGAFLRVSELPLAELLRFRRADWAPLARVAGLSRLRR